MVPAALDATTDDWSLEANCLREGSFNLARSAHIPAQKTSIKRVVKGGEKKKKKENNKRKREKYKSVHWITHH